MSTPSAALEASQAADSFLTLPEALQRIAELEKLSITLFATHQSAHDTLMSFIKDDAMRASLGAKNATLVAGVTRILGRPAMAMQEGA